jgi:hypothetical protein
MHERSAEKSDTGMGMSMSANINIDIRYQVSVSVQTQIQHFAFNKIFSLNLHQNDLKHDLLVGARVGLCDDDQVHTSSIRCTAKHHSLSSTALRVWLLVDCPKQLRGTSTESLL